jgi:hypothetical protein
VRGLQDLTERHITLAFVACIMKVIDDENPRTRVKLTHLAFEDWLEAICRLAACKSLPTDEQLKAAECESAGLYLRQLKADSPDEFDELIEAGARPWGAEPRMLIERCVDHMCSILIVTAQQGKGDCVQLTEKEAAAFIRLGGGAS